MLLSDYGLSQLVTVPTHRRGHILDWVVVRSEGSLLSVDSVQDCAGLSDHHAVVCSLAVSRPPPRTKLVTSRHVRAVCLSDFQNDVKAFAESTSAPLADRDLGDLVTVYDDGLLDILDHHAPLVTRRVRDRPSAPWMSEDLREARRRRRRAERRWRKTHLTIHRQIYVKERASVRSSVQATKRQYYCDKQLFSVSNELLGKSRATPFPIDVPPSDLPQHFCDFFAHKVNRIRVGLDSQSCDPPTFFVYEGLTLSQFEPVSEKEIHELIVQSPTKSCILDPIPTSLTKQCLTDLVPLITLET